MGKTVRLRRINNYGPEGCRFIEAMRIPLHSDDPIDRSVARTLCNYLYRRTLASDMIADAPKAFKFLRKQCGQSGRYEFRRRKLTEPFGPDNCLIIYRGDR